MLEPNCSCDWPRAGAAVWIASGWRRSACAAAAAWLLLWGTLNSLADDAPAPAELSAQVRKLIAELDADSLARRDEAERAIVALGPGALDAFPGDDTALDSEVQQRLQRIRQLLEARQVAESTRASQINLSGSLPLAEVLSALSTQSGNKIVDYRRNFGGEESNPQVRVDFHDTPFWQALDTVLDACELTTYGYAADQGRSVLVVSRSPHQTPRLKLVSYSGPFRVQPLRFESRRDLALDENDLLQLLLEITWEPRLQPVALVLPAAQIDIVGDGGEPLAVDPSQGEPQAEVMEGAAAVEIGIPLRLPPRSVISVARLSGTIQVLATSRTETFRFDELQVTKDKKQARREQRRGDVVVGIDRLRKNADLWELQIGVRFGHAGRGLESHRGWVYQNEAFFVGSDPQPIEPGAYEMTAQSDDAFAMKYLFDLPQGPDGLTFVYKTPTAIVEIPVEFELRDLPLP